MDLVYMTDDERIEMMRKRHAFFSKMVEGYTDLHAFFIENDEKFAVMGMELSESDSFLQIYIQLDFTEYVMEYVPALRSLEKKGFIVQTDTGECRIGRQNISGGEIDNIARKALMSEVLDGKTPSIDEIEKLCSEEKIGKISDNRVGFNV